MHREVKGPSWRGCGRAALRVGVACLLSTTAAPAQGGRPGGAADVAVANGDLEAAERVLFDAARRGPRDPAARLALGDWLASRGQLRAGAVLLEEARLFGGDAVPIAARLVHLYAWLGDWSSLAALPASPLSAPAKARAQALADRGPEILGADTTVVPFAPLEIGALGRMPLRIGSDTLWAELDPQEEGLVLPGMARGAGLVEIFGTDRTGPMGIVRECALGEITLRNMPVRIDASLGVGRARLGFDVFALLAPTVDARAGTVVMRRSARLAERDGEAMLPFVLGFPGVRLAVRDGTPLALLVAPAGRAALRGRPWTVDVRRGVFWVGTAR